MGFETSSALPSLHASIGLKYPYGIWNSGSSQAYRYAERLKYPYGIWNMVL